MTGSIQSAYTSEQVLMWLRGLLAIAWADGNFDPQEQEVIKQLVLNELSPDLALESLKPVSPPELVASLGQDPGTTENFLRTCAMVAVADGTYSASEDDLLQKFCKALGRKVEALEALQSTLEGNFEPVAPSGNESIDDSLDLLKPVRHWLDETDIRDPQVARFLCRMIPAQCPFEGDIKLFGNKVVHIPPLCKVNPLYEQLVTLRFRALSYLADECGEDVSAYC